MLAQSSIVSLSVKTANGCLNSGRVMRASSFFSCSAKMCLFNYMSILVMHWLSTRECFKLPSGLSKILSSSVIRLSL